MNTVIDRDIRRSQGSSGGGCDARQLLDVKSARPTVAQKKSCASPAWPTDTGAGSNSSTVRPPSSP